MHIGGMVKNSFVDFPNTLACVFFTTGCNMRCWYCHNSHLFDAAPKVSEQEALDFLKERKTFLEGVVISGGEPTLQPDLKAFITKIKKLGFQVKLDTNGSHPDILIDLVQSGLLDYVAMDIKAPLAKYEKVVGKVDFLQNVARSRDFLLQNLVDYEFRTTFSPDLTLADLELLCNEIKDAENFSLQRCVLPDKVRNRMQEKSFEEMKEGEEIAKKYVKNVLLKGVT